MSSYNQLQTELWNMAEFTHSGGAQTGFNFPSFFGWYEMWIQIQGQHKGNGNVDLSWVNDSGVAQNNRLFTIYSATNDEPYFVVCHVFPLAKSNAGVQINATSQVGQEVRCLISYRPYLDYRGIINR